MKQQLIAKFGKKFAASDKDTTPVLRGIHYAADGTVLVTNRHIALRIRDAHSFFSEPITLHAKTAQPIEGIYPDLARAMDKGNPKDTVVIPGSHLSDVTNRVRCMADVAARINKKTHLVTIQAEDGGLWVHAKGEGGHVQAKALLTNSDPKMRLTISLNAEYLHTALTLFADANVKELQIGFNGPLNPIYLTDDRDIDVVILPYRLNH